MFVFVLILMYFCRYYLLISNIIDEARVEIKLLRKLFQEGLLLAANVQPAPMESGRYILVFSKANGGEEQITKARGNEVKVYKRLNGALQDAQDIGFKEVSIRFE